MLTLSMHPVEYPVPFASRRLTTASVTPSGSRPIIKLSPEKSKGFWGKVGGLFKGCFSAA
jgi:hypothetical protein